MHILINGEQRAMLEEYMDASWSASGVTKTANNNKPLFVAIFSSWTYIIYTPASFLTIPVRFQILINRFYINLGINFIIYNVLFEYLLNIIYRSFYIYVFIYIMCS